MAWLSENWVWILLIGGMVAMHLFGHGHGGHGSHGGHCGQANAPRRSARPSDGSDDSPDEPEIQATAPDPTPQGIRAKPESH